MTAQQINPITLKKLSESAPYQVPHNAVVAAILISTPAPATRSEVEASLRLCEQNGWAIAVTRAVDGVKLWSLTDAGRAVVNELGL